jgi:hypothetical protein
MGVGGQCHALAALPPGNTRYPLYRRLGEIMLLEHLFESKNIRFNTRYMCDILVVYDLDLLSINMNRMHKNVLCKPPPENNKQMVFLNLLLIQLQLIFIEISP